MRAGHQHVLVRKKMARTYEMASCIAESAKEKMIEDILNYLDKREEYCGMKCSFEGLPCILISHRQLNWHPPMGMTSRCRISVTTAGEYVVHILMREIERGSLEPSPMDTIQSLCSKYSPFSLTHKFCPGIEPSKYEKYKEIIRFDPKSVRITKEPFSRVDSVSCMMWFELGKRRSNDQKQADAVICPRCVRLICDLERQVKRTEAESPSKKVKRQSASSHACLSYMSPSSQMKRKQNAKMERGNNKRKLQSYEHTELPLDTEQDSDMSRIVSVIEKECADDLEKPFC